VPCPKCQEEHALDLENKKKNEKLERAVKRAQAAKEHGVDIRLSDDASVSPLANAVMAGTVVSPLANGAMTTNQSNTMDTKLLSRDSFSSSCIDCCDDPFVCCFVGIPCCFPIAAVNYAYKIGISNSHGLCNLIGSVIVTIPCLFLCSAIMCHEKMLPCFATQLVQISMEKHNIKNAPDPCGDCGFCNCWFQATFCAPCMLCMLFREANKFPLK
jgi:hypothetical protein